MPLAPVAPTSEQQCDVLHDQFSALSTQLKNDHFACGRATRYKPGACDSTFRQWNQVLDTWLPTVNACRQAVREHLDREKSRQRKQAEEAAAAKAAEQERQSRIKQMQRDYEQMQNAYTREQQERLEATRRHIDEQQRAATEAERQRHDASQRAVNEAMRDLFSAKDRAEAYNAKATATGAGRNVPLTARDLRSLDAIRNQADANNLRPRYVPAESSGYAATNASGLTGAVANMLGAEVQTVLKWGLNQTETGSYLVQMFETAGDYDSKYQSFVSSVQYVRGALNGSTTYQQDVAAVGGTLGVLSGFAFRGTPAISIQLDRVFNSVSGVHRVGLDQLELLFVSLDRPLTAEEREQLSDAAAIRALYAPFLPLDRMDRMHRVVIEGAPVYDSSGFFKRIGR